MPICVSPKYETTDQPKSQMPRAACPKWLSMNRGRTNPAITYTIWPPQLVRTFQVIRPRPDRSSAAAGDVDATCDCMVSAMLLHTIGARLDAVTGVAKSERPLAIQPVQIEERKRQQPGENRQRNQIRQRQRRIPRRRGQLSD